MKMLKWWMMNDELIKMGREYLDNTPKDQLIKDLIDCGMELELSNKHRELIEGKLKEHGYILSDEDDELYYKVEEDEDKINMFMEYEKKVVKMISFVLLHDNFLKHKYVISFQRGETILEYRGTGNLSTLFNILDIDINEIW